MEWYWYATLAIIVSLTIYSSYVIGSLIGGKKALGRPVQWYDLPKDRMYIIYGLCMDSLSHEYALIQSKDKTETKFIHLPSLLPVKLVVDHNIEVCCNNGPAGNFIVFYVYHGDGRVRINCAAVEV